jgi:hypothetical protein
MELTAQSSTTNVEAILEHIFASRRITRRDQHIMMSNLMSQEGLTEKNIMQINQVFEGLKRGLIKVVD